MVITRWPSAELTSDLHPAVQPCGANTQESEPWIQVTQWQGREVKGQKRKKHAVL